MATFSEFMYLGSKNLEGSKTLMLNSQLHSQYLGSKNLEGSKTEASVLI